MGRVSRRVSSERHPSKGGSTPPDRQSVICYDGVSTVGDAQNLTYLPEPAPYLWVSERTQRRRLPVARVVWLQAERDYVRVHTAERSYLVRDRFTRLCGELEGLGFRRIHRGSAVNVGAVQCRFRDLGGGLKVALKGGLELGVGRTYAQGLQAALPRG